MNCKTEIFYKGFPIDLKNIKGIPNSDGTSTIIIPDEERNLISTEKTSGKTLSLRGIIKIELE